MRGFDSDSDRAAPPRILNLVLIAWETFDRTRRRIRPMRRAGILGLELARHRGRPERLADGTVVRPGDPVGEIHILNPRIRELDRHAGIAAVFREGRADLRALAAWASRQPTGVRPAAYHAEGIMARLAARERWEIRPRPRTPWRRVQDWYFRWLLVRWNPGGRERLRHGRGSLSSVDAWLSGAELEQRYGAHAADRGADPHRGPPGDGLAEGPDGAV